MTQAERDAECTKQDEMKVKDERSATSALESAEKFNQSVKETIRIRLQNLLTEAEENIATNCKLWAERTKYKIDIDRKNSSLAYLLQRAASALETVATADTSDAKRKDKKDHKSGGSVKMANISKDARKKK